jgi:hypothetical protein
MAALRWIEATIWLGILLGMGWVMYSIKRRLLRDALPALNALAERTGGRLDTRFYYLGAPVKLKGRYHQREMLLTLDFAHCTLALETWSTPPPRRYRLIHPEVAEGIRHTGNHLLCHLDLEGLKRDTSANGYLEEQLAGLAKAAVCLEQGEGCNPAAEQQSHTLGE